MVNRKPISPKSLKNLKPVKKGEVRNRLGVNGTTTEMREFRKMTKALLIEIGQKLLHMTREELVEYSKRPGTTMTELIFIRMMQKIMDKGDGHAFNAFFDRVFGKVKDEIEHSGAVDTGGQVIVTLPSNGTERM